MIIFKLIKAIFSGAVFFITIGLIVIVVSAMWSAFMDAELEDGTTIKETFVGAGHKIENAWIEAPPQGAVLE